MIKIGITGGIGSGKSTVSEIFALCGVPVYIADIESKKLTATSPIIREKLINLFGSDLFDENELNKAKLASYIFNDKSYLQQVNEIIHPEVGKDFIKWCDNHKDYKIVAKEAAILFESGFNRFIDKTIIVYTPLEERIKRSMRRDSVSKEQIIKRINNQMPDEEKVKLSDYIIVNDGTKSLIKQVLELISDLEKL